MSRHCRAAFGAALVLFLSVCPDGCDGPAFLRGLTEVMAQETGTPRWEEMEPEGQMPLQYADQFGVDYYPGGYARITIADEEEYLLVPEGKDVPEGLDESVTVLKQPLDSIYLGSSSAMDLFWKAGGQDVITMTSTAAQNWTIPEVREAVEQDDILYVGKYSAPDYEALLEEECTLALENTMIFHCPEVKEKLELLGIPVIVERSSYESHPLGRAEWIKLYGLLAGTPQQAAEFFEAGQKQLASIEETDALGKTVVFFYITSSGYANVRKSGDYIARMIEMAGGTYLFTDLGGESDNALSTVNMEMETFYAMARDADILIYNSTVDSELSMVGELLAKSPLLADFKAVRTGNVWCSKQNMFQQVSGTADMILDLHTVITGDNDRPLTFLRRLE